MTIREISILKLTSPHSPPSPKKIPSMCSRERAGTELLLRVAETACGLEELESHALVLTEVLCSLPALVTGFKCELPSSLLSSVNSAGFLSFA